ncbi:hypothetical protein B0H16DRAFT_65534 [Mycena metata]|uniref:Uncharacterized protein n=1 Tax=Mycena metata TaxID=1033252 RepID=A0AAD7MZE0_9AGAR|nr:hypothetical protein B0H16DRAFT_65534 [Mycena metata]
MCAGGRRSCTCRSFWPIYRASGRVRCLWGPYLVLWVHTCAGGHVCVLSGACRALDLRRPSRPWTCLSSADASVRWASGRPQPLRNVCEPQEREDDARPGDPGTGLSRGYGFVRRVSFL